MGTTAKVNSDRPDTVSFIRYPIFNREHQLWGYRIRCIDRSGEAGHRIPGEGDASGLVSSSASMGLEKLLSKGKSLMVDFNQKSVLQAIAYALPPANVAIRVSEKIPMEGALQSALQKMKTDGYRVAVSDFSGRKNLSAFYEMADIFCMKTAGKNRETLFEMMRGMLGYNATEMMGEQVRERSHFMRCQDIGFSLFQGAFFKTPQKISVRKISSNEAARFKLMKIIEESAPDLVKLAETIQSDVTISLRLLTYLNSAAFGLVRKVSSIQQAITLLGWKNIRKWLRVVVLSDVSSHSYSRDLVLLSSQRGKFLEKIIQEHDFWGFSPDSMFLLGVFSMLDALLGVPMEKIVPHLPLEDKLKSALLREKTSEYEPFLRLVELMEEGEWEEAGKMIQRLSMKDEKVKSAFHAAVDWADTLAFIHP